jgi:segregation and condensation protein B
MKLEQKIEALLFWKAEPMSIKKIAILLEEEESLVKNALVTLAKTLEERGVRIIEKDDEVQIGTAPEVSSLIEKLAKDELARDIGKAGLETLSTILYYGPISRRDIDYIRGVNSAFIERNLLVRGLIEKVEDTKDQRVFLYKPTFDLLAFLGISKVENLPDYEKVRSEFLAFGQAKEKIEKEKEPNVIGESGLENLEEGVVEDAGESEDQIENQ